MERKVVEHGACRGHPHPEWWTMNGAQKARVKVPVEVVRVGADGYRRHATEFKPAAWHAKQVCESCPVKSECRVLIDYIESGLPDNVQYYAGIWAGEGPNERHKRRLMERREATAA